MGQGINTTRELENPIPWKNQRNTLGKLHETQHGRDLLKRFPEAQIIKAKIDKQNGMKQRSFCTAKEPVNKVERQAAKWDKTL